MESLENILKTLGPTISSAGTSESNANAAIADAEYHCEICDDARWLSLGAPVGSPEFGRVIPCHCQERVWGVSPHDRLLHYSDLGALQRLTFDTLDPSGRPDYVEPASFRRAQLTAARFAQRPVGWLVLTGPSGTGKTHLAAAITNSAISRGQPARFVVVPELLDHLRATFSPDADVRYDDLFDQVVAAPLLVLDDLGGHSPSPWAEEKLDQILTHRYDGRMPTVLTSSKSPDEMPDRIRARMIDSTFSTVATLKPSAVQAAPDDLGIEPRLRKSMTFATFDRGGGYGSSAAQKERLSAAFEAARTFAEKPDGWLYLAGSAGVGKTHLAVAIANETLEVGNEVIFRFVPDLLDHLRKSFSPTSQVTYDALFDRIKNADLLILDDLGSQAFTPWAEEKLYQIIVHRYDAYLPTVITGSVLLESADGRGQDSGRFGTRYSEAIWSRVRDATVVVERFISAPDYRFRGRPKSAPGGRALRGEPADADCRRARFRLHILPNRSRTRTCQVGVGAGPRHPRPLECRMGAGSGRRGRGVFCQQVALGTGHAPRRAAWPLDTTGDVARDRD